MSYCNPDGTYGANHPANPGYSYSGSVQSRIQEIEVVVAKPKPQKKKAKLLKKK